MKKQIFVFLSRNRRKLLFREVLKFVGFLVNAFSNKNNNHFQNGESELQSRLTKMGIRIVFDVGANTGDWSKRISKLTPMVKVFAFEPIPSTFQKLKENLNYLVNIEVIEKGLSDQEGEVKFFQFSANSLFSSQLDRIEFQDKVQVVVNLTTGKKFCFDHQISSIDFLKIDVEGMEMSVLLGFEELINSGKIRVIQFEYGPMNIESRTYLKDFYDFLLPKGYLIGKLFPDGVEFCSYKYHLDDFKWANYVAVKDSDSEIIELIKV